MITRNHNIFVLLVLGIGLFVLTSVGPNGIPTKLKGTGALAMLNSSVTLKDSYISYWANSCDGKIEGVIKFRDIGTYEKYTYMFEGTVTSAAECVGEGKGVLDTTCRYCNNHHSRSNATKSAMTFDFVSTNPHTLGLDGRGLICLMDAEKSNGSTAEIVVETYGEVYNHRYVYRKVVKGKLQVHGCE